MILASKNGTLSSCKLLSEDEDKFIVQQFCNKTPTKVWKGDESKKLFDGVDEAIEWVESDV